MPARALCRESLGFRVFWDVSGAIHKREALMDRVPCGGRVGRASASSPKESRGNTTRWDRSVEMLFRY